MTAVPLSTIRAALDDAGILIREHGELPERVTGLAEDSRLITPGALFVAVRGSERDGHTYLSDAAARGASAAIVEVEGVTSLPSLVVRDGRLAAALSAGAFYDHPARSLQLIAVTGTNGKTTTAGIIRHLLDSSPGPRSASIGTLGVLLGSEGESLPGGSGLTTPGPVELQRVLRALVQRGVSAAAMEVSSHSLDQRRVEGLTFAAAVFTNLTHDHLDYHTTMEAYFAAKARLFDESFTDLAVVSVDDPYGRLLLDAATVRTVPYALDDADDLRLDVTGSTFRWRGVELHVPLAGRFNVCNAVAAATVAAELGIAMDAIVAGMAATPPVRGRFEPVVAGQPFGVVVDYAHTPDALENVLAAAREVTAPGGRVVVVFGAGGQRDAAKRPRMGEVAGRLADRVVVTSDNPRSEDPAAIIDAITAGIGPDADAVVVEDRAEAIRLAISDAEPGDLVVLAGKGHETTQTFADRVVDFDDAEVARGLLAERGWSA